MAALNLQTLIKKLITEHPIIIKLSCMNIEIENIIYAGSNSGVLHAIDADTGQEEWAFVPPFIAAKLPMIINKDYDQLLLGESGGSNPIFGVDGSPVVHDVFIRGLDPRTGILEPDPSWHTVLFVPYGRGVLVFQ